MSNSLANAFSSVLGLLRHGCGNVRRQVGPHHLSVHCFSWMSIFSRQALTITSRVCNPTIWSITDTSLCPFADKPLPDS